MLDWTDLILRLGAATVAGGLIGLNRDLHGKPIGIRTLGIVSLGTAMIIILVVPSGGHVLSDAASRVVQGTLTGIGFLGAGVIVRTAKHNHVHGLTSAACTWLTACIGIICGAGAWQLVAAGLGFTFVLLLLGGPIERRLHRLLRAADNAADAPTQAAEGSTSQPTSHIPRA